ncbi:uncharacterized protein [Periplaneta americana]|uniref:uncharacterized protein isoform X2 n=1 Tax=Periplaneta americana TaxID=6978 RepID=UPI0037E8AC95
MESYIDLDESSNSNSKFDHSDCSTDAGEGTPGIPGGPLNAKQRIATALKKLTLNDNMKFMENFDPERSNRERRKLTRKIYNGGQNRKWMYDSIEIEGTDDVIRNKFR